VAEADLPAWFAELPKLDRYHEIDEVLRSPDFEQGTHVEGAEFLGGSLLLIDGDEHFERRRLESPLFGRDALRYYERHALQPVVDRTIDEARRDGRADLAAMTRTMLYRIAAATTGIDGVEEPGATATFIDLVDRLGNASTVQWSTRPHDVVIAEGLEARAQLVDCFYEPSLARRRSLVEQHRNETLALTALPRDLITSMLLHEAGAVDETMMLREATLYLIAATRTTSHAVPHAVHHLDEWLASHPEDRERVGDLEFLQAVAGEVLRLHPPSPALVRRAIRDVTLGSSGRSIAKGQRVGLLFRPANRDPDVFGADAGRFDPRRTMPSGRKRWGLSFGGGEHLCIGRALVTGTAARGDEGPIGGTLTMILGALTRAGVRPDGERPPQIVTTSLYEAYATFPIVLAS
jgi:cytochrome P450